MSVLRLEAIRKLLDHDLTLPLSRVQLAQQEHTDGVQLLTWYARQLHQLWDTWHEERDQLQRQVPPVLPQVDLAAMEVRHGTCTGRTSVTVTVPRTLSPGRPSAGMDIATSRTEPLDPRVPWQAARAVLGRYNADEDVDIDEEDEHIVPTVDDAREEHECPIWPALRTLTDAFGPEWAASPALWAGYTRQHDDRFSHAWQADMEKLHRNHAPVRRLVQREVPPPSRFQAAQLETVEETFVDHYPPLGDGDYIQREWDQWRDDNRPAAGRYHVGYYVADCDGLHAGTTQEV